MVAVGEPVALGMIVYVENSQFGADRCPLALPMMLVIMSMVLGSLALAPTISLYGPRMLLFYFRGTVVGACFLIYGQVSIWISNAAWLIYFSGVVVIFMFFSFRAPNPIRIALGYPRFSFIVGAVASFLMGTRTPLF